MRHVVLVGAFALCAIFSGCGDDGGGVPVDGSMAGDAPMDGRVGDGSVDPDATIDGGYTGPRRIGSQEHGPSDTGALSFGAAVTIEGDTAFVGAPAADGTGAVYRFALSDGIWVEVEKITARDGDSGDRFGAAVDYDGTTLIVGAPGRSSLFREAGQVYALEDDGTGFVEVARITRDPGSPTSPTGSGGMFGSQVALAGDAVFVAAPAEGRPASPGANPDVGAVFVFEKQDDDSYAELTALRMTGSMPDHFVGAGMDADGARIAATCVEPCADQVALFEGSGASWTESVLTQMAPFEVGRLGPSVAVLGDTVAVAGAPSGTGATFVAGAVVLFEPDLSTTPLLRLPADPDVEADQRDRVVAMSTGALVITSRAASGAGTDLPGTIAIYEDGDEGWALIDEESYGTESRADSFGVAVDYDGRWGVAGSPDRDVVRFFTLVREDCMPTGCEPRRCLPISDGCGGALDCPACTAPESCGGGGVAGYCDCTEDTVSETRGATMARDEAGIGSRTWDNTGRATTSDDSWATVSAMTGGQVSHFLVTSGFGFDVPADATITGIEVEVERRGLSGVGLVDEAIRIVKGGAIGTADRSLPDRWEREEASVIYGGASDPWGETWTPAEVNDPDFGVAVAVRYASTAGNDWPNVDHVRARIHYRTECPCPSGEVRDCYPGPAGTLGVGVCAAGTKTCAADGSGWSACASPMTPSPEMCGNTVDDDCNGEAEETCVCPPSTSRSCYTGPAATQGVGECAPGMELCPPDGAAWSACMGDVVPVTETCGDGTDADCDSAVDEGCVAGTRVPFAFTGGTQSFVVPAGVTQITVKAWGGGGGGRCGWDPDHGGGGGAFVRASFPVTPGETLSVIVGGGGSGNVFSSNPGGFGGGGAGGAGTWVGFGAGGRSEVHRAGTSLIVAGGGGGAGNRCGGAGNGGAGGGGDGGNSSATGGGGGTMSAGGAAGGSGVDGASGTGGRGGGGGSGGGGGGGGGYFGGGGGGSATSGAGGGGGSSFVTGTGTVTVMSDEWRPANALDPDYSTGTGHGGNDIGESDGEPGSLVIFY